MRFSIWLAQLEIIRKESLKLQNPIYMTPLRRKIQWSLFLIDKRKQKAIFFEREKNFEETKASTDNLRFIIQDIHLSCQK